MGLTHMLIVGRIEQHLRECETCKVAVANIDARAIALHLSRDEDVRIWLYNRNVTAEGLEAIILVHIGTFYHSEQPITENRVPVESIEDGSQTDLYTYVFYQAGLHLLTCYECRYGTAHRDTNAVAAHIMLDSVIMQAIEDEEVDITTVQLAIEQVLHFLYSCMGETEEELEAVRRSEDATERWLENGRRSDNQVYYDTLADEAATLVQHVANEIDKRRNEVQDYQPLTIIIDELPSLNTQPIGYQHVAPEVISTIQNYVELHITECATCSLTITIPNQVAIADCIAHTDLIESYLTDKLLTRHDLYTIVTLYLQDKPLYLVDHTPDNQPIKKSWNELQHMAIAGVSPTTNDLRCHIVEHGNQCYNQVRNNDVYGRCLNCTKPTCGKHSTATPDDIDEAMKYLTKPGEVTSLGNLDGRVCLDCLLQVDNPYSTHNLTVGQALAELHKSGYQDVTPEERYKGAFSDYAFKSPLGGVCYCYNNQEVFLLLEGVRRIGHITECEHCGKEEANLCQYCGTCNACYPGVHTPCLAGVPYYNRDERN